jgi:formate hydrogenlyase subunit 3/multisubunit Na+/H+ antiporter MnhD subunit
MQVPVIAGAKQTHPAGLIEPIRCALVARPTKAEKQKREMLRYVVMVVALVAVLFLIAIALYYTQGNSVSIEHVSSLSPALRMVRLS